MMVMPGSTVMPRSAVMPIMQPLRDSEQSTETLRFLGAKTEKCVLNVGAFMEIWMNLESK